MDYKWKSSHELTSDVSLPDELNSFYAHFEASNTEPCMRALTVPDNCVISLSVADVRKTWLTFTRPRGQTLGQIHILSQQIHK
jgi:hypothetical protein